MKTYTTKTVVNGTLETTQVFNACGQCVKSVSVPWWGHRSPARGQCPMCKKDTMVSVYRV